jgi:hypothetical protein
MNEELSNRIVSDLAKQRNRNEIIRGICEQEGLNWADAEKLVAQVEQQNAHAIARRQSPLLIFLSVSTVLIGIVLLLFGVDYVMPFFQGHALEQLLSLQTGYYQLAGGLTGVVMIVGGVIGLWKTLLQVFET